MDQQNVKVAKLYRMATEKHICPFGLRSKHLLKKNGYAVEDHLLTDREQTDAFKQKHNVKTTPQTFIDNERVGGYDDLRKFFGMRVKDPDAKTYTPVIAIFSVGALIALAIAYATGNSLVQIRTLEWFVAVSMCLLGLQKLRDLDGFTNGFLGYDLLAQKYVPYARVYPFIETGAGVLMIANLLVFLAAPAALFIASIGAVSVIKAVYIDNRDIKCACVGGNSNVPLGFISLTENLMMIAISVWMLFK